MLYLVRHAKAGNRSDSLVADRARPLTGKGRRQALAVAERLADCMHASVSQVLVSSPYRRCVQTLEPLGLRLASPVVTDERLTEGAGFEGVLALLASLPDGSVLCSHGDVIPATIEALVRRGCRVIDEPDWRKASVWLLRRNDDGSFSEATAWPPPTAA